MEYDHCGAPDKFGYISIGIALLWIGLTALWFAMRKKDDIMLSIDCISWACHFLMHTPSTVLLPPVVVASRILVTWIMWQRFRKILSSFTADFVLVKEVDMKDVYLAAFSFIMYL